MTAELGSYWTKMGQTIKAQHEAFKRSNNIWTNSPKLEPHEMEELLLLSTNASDLGFDNDYTEEIVIGFAKQNRIPDGSIDEVLRQGDWFALARALYHDYRDVALALPATATEDVQRVRQVIACLRAEYFDELVYPEDEDQPRTWCASDKAVDLRSELLDDWETARGAMVHEVIQKTERSDEKLATHGGLFREAITGSNRREVGVDMRKKKKKILAVLEKRARRKRDELRELNESIERETLALHLTEKEMLKSDEHRERDRTWDELDCVQGTLRKISEALVVFHPHEKGVEPHQSNQPTG